jgi:ABC-type branched-subunit amino acid transport system substrate-binding protein
MARSRTWTAVIAVVCAFTLTAGLAACSSSDDDSSGGGGNTTGVTDTSIKIGVAVSDLDGLRAAGFALAPALTTQNLSKRLTSYFDEWNAAGGINGRQVEGVVMTWDPVKPTTAQKVCDDATINTPVFAMINSNGMGAKYIECIAQAGVPIFFGDVAPQSAHDTGWLTTISPSAEVNAKSGIDAAIKSGQIPKGAAVGILSGNGPEHLSAVAATKTSLEANGNKVTVAQINTLQGDPGIQNTESAAAVNTFKAANVTNIAIALQFTASNGFWDNAGGNNWQFTFLDVASSMCTPYGGKSLKPSAVGGICFTVFGDSVTPDGKLLTESAFEKECRAKFDALSANDFGGAPSYAGVPSGETRTLPDGTKVSSDAPPNECTITNVMKRALEKAGKNLSRESFMKALRGLGEVDIAGGSNGIGSQKEGKTYLATLTHPVKLTAAPTGTAKNATGTYNGCPVDVQCWVPTGTTWFDIAS